MIGIQDILALSIALAAMAFMARFVWKSFSGGQGCGSCPSSSKSKTKISSTMVKRTPLVSLEMPSKPNAESKA